MANLITCMRILCAAALAFLPVLSPSFYAVYLLAGVSDMLDGFIARRTNTASSLGAKLDTLADFVFAAVCLIRLLPLFVLPPWLCSWIALIAAIKFFNMISGWIMHRRFVSEHTRLNKLTGLLLLRSRSCCPLSISRLPQASSARSPRLLRCRRDITSERAGS